MREGLCCMEEGKERGCRELLHKHGLIQVVDILENCERGDR